MKYAVGSLLILLFRFSKIQAQVLTQWTPYSDCSATCNVGNQVRTRTRSCTPSNLCQQFSLFDTTPCNTQYACPDYRLGDWGSWSACSESCRATQSYPTRVRSRSYCLSSSTSTYQCTSDFIVNYEPCNIVACSIVKSCNNINFTFVFVMDSSASVDSQEWADEKQLVLTFVNSSSFGVNPNVDVAVINFGSFATIEADCGTFKGFSDFTTFMNNIKQIGGGTAIHQGLISAETVFKRCQKLNMNPVIILLTDGYENMDYDVDRDTKIFIRSNSNIAKLDDSIIIENRIKQQALVYAGATRDYNKGEIDRITSYIVNGQNVSYAIFADNFTVLYSSFANTLYPTVVQKTQCETQGQWTAWAAWSSCSVVCGATGYMQRSRSCINPTTNVIQGDCEPNGNIANLDEMTCSFPCRTFSAWSSWGACSASCKLESGPGISSRSRTCLPGLGSCIGDLAETQECNTNIPCQGIIASWGAWGQCSATCQLTSVLPTQERSRICVGATLGGNCDGQPLLQSQSCSINVPCPGTVSEWSSWGACSAVCNNLVNVPFQTSTRSCTGYSTYDPNYTGCPGFSLTKQQSCNTDTPCSGSYGEWGAWGSCSETCQSNPSVTPFQTQSRVCLGATLGGGCSGSSSQTRSCSTGISCPGVLSLWSEWGDCSATCQLNFVVPQKIRTRTCSGASLGGNCNGEVLSQSSNCLAEVPCPGTLSGWGDWGACSASCNTQVNGPYQYRTQTCDGVSTWNPNYKGCIGAVLSQQQLCNQIVPCPGNYGEWGAWSTCSETCQSNPSVSPFQTQTRQCLGFTLNGGCSGPASQTRTCSNGISCPGTLSQWGAWGSCSASCQMFYTPPTQSSTRQCIGATFNGNCNGEPLIKTQNCLEQVKCPGTISGWSSWGACSASCNNLVTVPSRTRSQFCIGYSTFDPSYKGCDGIPTSDQQACNDIIGCPGNYGEWNAWSICSETCQSNSNAVPFQTQTRQCIGATFGVGCVGPSSQTKSCNSGLACPGVLSLWSEWGDCSATCQLNFVVPQKIRTRTCSGASLGGNCNGEVLSQSSNCLAEVPCPGTLSGWGGWSVCSASCNTQVNGPYQYRTQTCDGVSTWNPNYKGCNNAVLNQQQLCNQDVPCPGYYTTWSVWSTCSESCQSNTNTSPSQMRTRNCLNFTLNGGCSGASSETSTCNFQTSCPGDLTQWSGFSACSQSCQLGSVVPTMSRSRSCLNPTFGGNCLGQPLIDTQPCSAGVSCPGQLTDWTQWSQCPATCQQTAGQFNLQYRSRQCLNTSYSGNCNGQLLNDQTPCVVNVPCPGILGQWTSYSVCSESCVSNTLVLPSQTRTRTCTTATLGANCGGVLLSESSSCNSNVGCPGAWTSWGPFTECSASCQSNANNIPTQSRQRFCVNNTLNGACPSDNNGDKVQTVQCNAGVICPVIGTWGAWNAWSTCSASCDAGVIQRSRVCSTPYPPGAGNNCIGNSTQSLPCKLFDCPLSCAIPKPCTCAQVKQWSTVPTFDQFQSRNLNLAAIDNVLGFLKSYGDDTVDKACEACNTMLLTTLRSNVANQLDQAKAARANLELIKKDLHAVINCNGVILNNAGLWSLYDLIFERATMLEGVIIELNAIYLRFDAALTSCQSYGWIHQTFKTILRKCNL